MGNSRFLLNFFSVRSNFSKDFFWTSFFDLKNFSFDFFYSMGQAKQSLKPREDSLFSYGYDKGLFFKFFSHKFFSAKKVGNFSNFSFLGSLFFNKISDFFVFKANNKFDLLSFFENKNFDFIIYNHIFNYMSFFQVLDSCVKMKKLEPLFSAVAGHYEPILSDTSMTAIPHPPLVEFFFERDYGFKEVPEMFLDSEKALAFYFDYLWNFFYKLEKILG